MNQSILLTFIASLIAFQPSTVTAESCQDYGSGVTTIFFKTLDNVESENTTVTIKNTDQDDTDAKCFPASWKKFGTQLYGIASCSLYRKGNVEIQVKSSSHVYPPFKSYFCGSMTNSYLPSSAIIGIKENNTSPIVPTYTVESWGLPDDKPLLGKFFSPDKEDIGVFRPSNGMFYLKQVGASVHKYLQFGYGTDLPMVGEFFGNGLSQIAVFRPSEGNWHILNPLDGVHTSVKWGMEGDVPMPGKFFPGSTKLSLAVFRPSTGMIYILKSDGSYQSIKFGTSEDQPVVGDFQGLGYDQVAFFRKSTGQWLVYNPVTEAHVATVSWGLSDDKPLAGRLTGQSHDLIAFRESTGVFHAMNLNGSTVSNHWGMLGDKPLAGKVKNAEGSKLDNMVVYRNGTWYIKH